MDLRRPYSHKQVEKVFAYALFWTILFQSKMRDWLLTSVAVVHTSYSHKLEVIKYYVYCHLNCICGSFVSNHDEDLKTSQELNYDVHINVGG